MKALIFGIIIVGFIGISCGSNPSNPEGEGPTPSVLVVECAGKGDCTVLASWTICPDEDFANYVLYRSQSENISSNPSSAEVLCSIDDANVHFFEDTTVLYQTIYYYALRTANDAGQYSWSNEDSLSTPGGESWLFFDTFTFPDSSDPDYWFRTGGTGDGYYSVMNNTFAHTSGDHCSYYRFQEGYNECGDGVYEFDTYGPYWEFGWRVTPTDPAHGYCRRLGNYPNWWSGYFMRPYAEWSGDPFAWQEGEGTTLHNYGGPDPAGLHHITVHDTGTWITATVDSEVVFDLYVTEIPPGLVGFAAGDTSGGEPGYIPWYDNFLFTPEY